MGFWDNKQVIVTGGAGFLGSAIVRKLRERHAQDVIVPRSADYDLRRPDDIERLFDLAAHSCSPEQTLLIQAAVLSRTIRRVRVKPHEPRQQTR